MQDQNTEQVLFAAGVAAHMGWGTQSFYNRKRELAARYGFPRPIAIPGRERWLRSDIDAWLASRSQAAQPAAEPAAVEVKAKPGRKRNAVPAGGRE